MRSRRLGMDHDEQYVYLRRIGICLRRLYPPEIRGGHILRIGTETTISAKGGITALRVPESVRALPPGSKLMVKPARSDIVAAESLIAVDELEDIPENKICIGVYAPARCEPGVVGLAPGDAVAELCAVAPADIEDAAYVAHELERDFCEQTAMRVGSVNMSKYQRKTRRERQEALFPELQKEIEKKRKEMTEQY